MNVGQARFPEGDVVIYDDRDEACCYQIARIREWTANGELTFVPLTDPRVVLWYGDQNGSAPQGMIAFVGADGTRVDGAEALEWIIHRLPSGKSTMLAAMRGESRRQRFKRPYSGLMGEILKNSGPSAGSKPMQADG